MDINKQIHQKHIQLRHYLENIYMKNIRFPLSLSQGGEMNPGNKHDREFINAGCWGWVPAGSLTETKSQNINK